MVADCSTRTLPPQIAWHRNKQMKLMKTKKNPQRFLKDGFYTYRKIRAGSSAHHFQTTLVMIDSGAPFSSNEQLHEPKPNSYTPVLQKLRPWLNTAGRNSSTITKMAMAIRSLYLCKVHLCCLASISRLPYCKQQRWLINVTTLRPFCTPICCLYYFPSCC